LLVDLARDLPLLDRMDQVRADVLGPEVIGRGVKVPGEIGDPVDVEADRLGGPVVEDQVMRRRSGIVGGSLLGERRGHGVTSVRRFHDQGAPRGMERRRENGVAGGRKRGEHEETSQAATWRHGTTTGIAFGPP
jgi:hypothetical protein